jgi:hypothetical protein
LRFKYADFLFLSLGFLSFSLNFDVLAMAKKKKRNAEKAEHIIDNIPNKYSQKPRSSKPKRRSDFSFFYSFPLSNSGVCVFCLIGIWKSNSFSFSLFFGLSSVAMFIALSFPLLGTELVVWFSGMKVISQLL